ncbi:MAG: UbiA family prenyltransferase [Flavobacteriales bacterium]|nr:UbiA family prenyltransferase [Flavobacteriales bacterium]
MSTVKNYLSLVKFSHTIFALPFAVIGFFLAVSTTETELNWMTLGLVILCMVFARSAAMAFNRYLDRDIDVDNERTAIREIPTGDIKAKSALLFVIANCLLFIGSTYFINSLCFYLSPVALAVVLGYSYTKRFTALCHLVLGVGLSLAPIGAFLAVTGEFMLLPLLFSFAVLFWVSGFDIIYALQDEEFDKSHQLHSIPVWLGTKGALNLSNLFHMLTALSIIFAGYYGGFSWIYWIGAAFFCGLLIYQHLLVKPNDLSKINLAFFTTNGIASVIFAIFVLADIYVN